MNGSSAINSAQENGVRCLPTHRHCHVTDAQRAPLLLRSTHGAFRPTATPFSLSQMPFIDTAGLAGVLGEAHATVHRGLTGLLADGIVGRVSHGTAHLPSSQRYYLTAKGIGEAAETLGFETPSDFVRAYPVSREWLALLIRRMDVVAAVYRIAASLSPGIDALRSHVEVPSQGPLRRHHHPPRRPDVQRAPPEPGPATPVALRPAESYSGIRLHPPPRHRSDPDAQHLGGEADDEVLRGTEPPWMLRRRGVQGRAGKTGPSPLVLHLVDDRQQVLHAGGRQLPRQPRRKASHGVAEPEACFDTRP